MGGEELGRIGRTEVGVAQHETIALIGLDGGDGLNERKLLDLDGDAELRRRGLEHVAAKRNSGKPAGMNISVGVAEMPDAARAAFAAARSVLISGSSFSGLPGNQRHRALAA